MEIFKSTVLNNEFDELVKEIILTLEKCGRYDKFFCGYCNKVSIFCSRCREECCKNCWKFTNSSEVFLNNRDHISKKYVADFVSYCFNAGEITAKFFNIKVFDNAVKKEMVSTESKVMIKGMKVETK